MSAVKVARSDAEISSCFDVIAELRTHLERASFLELIRMMEDEGYRMAYIEASGSVVAVAGFRIMNTLFMGKNLYVDDLVSSANARSRGHGKALIDWLRAEAERAGCTHLHLDSGTQRHRAHRFYLREGLDIESFHFSQKLSRS